MTLAEELHSAIAAVCPIDGVGVDSPADKSSWTIHFSPQATDDERKAAAAALAAFDAPAALAGQTAAVLEAAVQRYMDGQAQARGYDDLRSAISYRGDANPTWAHEAEVFFAWRSSCWQACIAMQAEVQAGKRAVPTADELIAALPALVF